MGRFIVAATLGAFFLLPAFVPALAGPVPDTGQINSHTAIFGEDSDYILFPAEYSKVSSGGADLPDNASEWAAVRDVGRGLLWEVKADLDGDASATNHHDADNTYALCPAAGADACAVTGTSAYDDLLAQLNSEAWAGCAAWRLPTLKELSWLVSRGAYAPAIDAAYFPAAISGEYWTGTPVDFAIDQFWCVSFDQGIVNYVFNRPELHSVRAVCEQP